ncbi:MAG: AmmeMemoRadiSam system protein B [Alphaproteobacteria bacterium]|nr:AmmeMemoRadiSam system protein B [Alphaproteobacteria bacterium]
MKQKSQDENSSKIRRYIIISLIVVVLAVVNVIYFRHQVSSNHSLASHYTSKGDPMEKYRNPAVAGYFYPVDSTVLNQAMDELLSLNYQQHLSQPKIIVVPHAGYQFSAVAAAQAYLPLKDFASNIKNVILLGPSHYEALEGAALPKAQYFKTPLGVVEVNTEIASALLKNNMIKVNDKAHEKEHSLEVQLPFLQKLIPNLKIVPIVYGNMNPQEMADALQPYLQKDDTLLVVSADLSHYHPYNEAVQMDTETALKVEEGQDDIDYHHSCGAGGINTALKLAKAFNYKPEVLALINSGDVSNDKSRVVGYGAWSFSQKGLKITKIAREREGLLKFASEYGQPLIAAAHKSLEQSVKGKNYHPDRGSYDDHLFDRGASFVTLTKQNELRGCIGSLYPRKAVVADVVDNARAAALNDTRFSPLTAEELPDIAISISLLTGFEKIRYTDEQDLLNQLVPNVDGVIIRDGSRQGLFLPSVWVQLPDKKAFLDNLKLKAGMSPSFWSNDIQVYRFYTVEIKENAN